MLSVLMMLVGLIAVHSQIPVALNIQVSRFCALVRAISLTICLNNRTIGPQ